MQTCGGGVQSIQRRSRGYRRTCGWRKTTQRLDVWGNERTGLVPGGVYQQQWAPLKVSKKKKGGIQMGLKRNTPEIEASSGVTIMKGGIPGAMQTRLTKTCLKPNQRQARTHCGPGVPFNTEVEKLKKMKKTGRGDVQGFFSHRKKFESI